MKEKFNYTNLLKGEIQLHKFIDKPFEMVVCHFVVIKYDKPCIIISCT